MGAWIFTVTTLIYVKLDRSDEPIGPWTVDSLPARGPNKGTPSGRTELVVGIVAVVLVVTGLVFVSVPWDGRRAGHRHTDSHRHP